MKKIFVLAALVAVSMVGSVQGDAIIANWTFETSGPTTAGPHAPEAGSQAATAVATGFHADALAVYSNPAGNGSTESFSSNFWTTEGDHYRFQFSMVGLENATFQWDQTRSSTGPSDFSLQWSVDNINFTSILDYTVAQVGWSTNPDNNSPDSTFGPVALPTAVNGQASVFVRLRSNVALLATTGTNRIDNVIVTASAIPEPTSAALLGLGLAGLSLVRRRK